MTIDRDRWWAVGFGRDGPTVERFMIGAGATFVLLLLVANVFDAGQLETVSRFQYTQGLVVVAVVGASMAHAYTNDGFVISIALAYVLLQGVVLGGYQSIATFGGRPPGPSLLAMLPLSFAVVLGGIGFVLGAGGRRLMHRIRS